MAKYKYTDRDLEEIRQRYEHHRDKPERCPPDCLCWDVQVLLLKLTTRDNIVLVQEEVEA